MRTVELSAIEYAQSIDDNDYTIETESAFIAGVKFAQKFHTIERYFNGYITNGQSLEIERNLPAILKKEDGYKGNEYFIACDIDEVFETNHGWTHWRPIELK